MKETKKEGPERQEEIQKNREVKNQFQEENCHWYQIPAGFQMKDSQWLGDIFVYQKSGIVM